MVDEDPFPPVVLVNIVAIDVRVVLNERKMRSFLLILR